MITDFGYFVHPADLVEQILTFEDPVLFDNVVLEGTAIMHTSGTADFVLAPGCYSVEVLISAFPRDAFGQDEVQMFIGVQVDGVTLTDVSLSGTATPLVAVPRITGGNIFCTNGGTFRIVNITDPESVSSDIKIFPPTSIKLIKLS
ncbi:hypothetical protein [Rossellomorea yichunensis]|uniref:hypothetical protein n=1 Tax=Rossellomorea yichunensis TaxID=3077331 RepID=UPI0028DEA7DE|nr:hypothetical protein [Rossellomorea sp. YC4-1]MDT9027827.1 hypothetical protein [Rossellomorea sp. YC4-1]